MGRKVFTPEQIIGMLRQAEVGVSLGQKVGAALVAASALVIPWMLTSPEWLATPNHQGEEDHP